MCSLGNTTGPKIGSSYFKKKQNKQTDKRERERERISDVPFFSRNKSFVFLFSESFNK